MSSVQFAFWLQGYFEIHGKDEPLTAEQVSIIKRHLAMVFAHEIDPSYPAEQQDILSELHDKPESPNKPTYQLLHNVDPHFLGLHGSGVLKPRC